jgi:hypothetical protein
MGWVRDLELISLSADVALLRVKPGQRDVGKFVQSENPQARLSELLSRVYGRPLRFQIEDPATPLPSEKPLSPIDQARALPIVRLVMETFSDVRVLSVREVSPAAEGPDDKPPSTAGESSPGV